MTPPVLPFILPGCSVDTIRTVASVLLLEAHTTAPTATCPDCRQPSARIHSRYTRLLRDLPVTQQAVRVLLRVRRFFCMTSRCPRRTFAERLPELAPFRAQRTVRLTQTIHVLGIALGGEHAARVADQLGMHLSGDTLLRIVRATPAPERQPARVIGVDDFAFRKGRVYGTLVVDLAQHHPIDLLPDRSAETLASWLREHEGVEVIARDRAQDYARGATEGAPDALQVADRFHLLGNGREVLERYVQRVAPALRRVLASDPAAEVLTPPEPTLSIRPLPRYGRSHQLQQLQDARQAERQQRYQQVKARAAQGLSQRQIASECGLSTKTVRHWLRAPTLPPETRGYRSGGKIDRYVAYLQARLAEGCTNQSRLWREIREQGFSGTRSLVGKWIRTHGRSAITTATAPQPALPAPKQLSWLLFHSEQERTAEEHQLWERLQAHGELVQVQDLMQQFTAMVRQRQLEKFDTWLTGCQSSSIPEIRNFADGLQRDYAAVKAALSLPWSTGPVEGHINRLKLIKRSGYGRMHLDLLRQRVLNAA